MLLDPRNINVEPGVALVFFSKLFLHSKFTAHLPLTEFYGMSSYFWSFAGFLGLEAETIGTVVTRV